jgi:hypothetical protein
MATKTWKIGECCVGGIITANVTGKTVEVQIKDWDFSKGSRRSSDQSQAQVLHSAKVKATDAQSESTLLDYLCENTTSYHADQVIDWIKTKVTLNNTNW